MMTKSTFFTLIFLLVLFSTSATAAQSQEPGSPVNGDDCSDVSIRYKDHPELTRQEKIGLMDQALFHSLNKYEGCQRHQANTASSGGGANNGQADSDDRGTNTDTGPSTASSDISGTETPAVQLPPTDEAGDSPSPESMPISNRNRHVQKTPVKGGGKIPDDIPPVDNDSVLEAQIRHAAMIETDPVIREKLWNEYRKYKGLPARTSRH